MAVRIVPEGGWQAPGLKTARPDRKRKLVRERGRQEDAAHLALIRKLPCLITGERERVEAAHIRYSSALYGKANPGTGAKPDDRWTVPLCARLHTEAADAQHRSGEEWWWEERGINPLLVAQRLHDLSAGLRAAAQPEDIILAAMTAIIERARREARHD